MNFENSVTLDNREMPIERHVRIGVEEALSDTPIVLLVGARQVGKTTIARQFASKSNAVFVSLDSQNSYDFAQRDPEGFVRQAGEGLLIIDEVQRCPQLVFALKETVDSDRRPGRFLLTGSVALFAAAPKSDSLAGRIDSIDVYPFSVGEKHGRDKPEDWVSWLVGSIPKSSSEMAAQTADLTDLEFSDLATLVCDGGFPEPTLRRSARRIENWHAMYLRQLASRDLADQLGVEYPERFSGITRLLAARGVTELVAAKMARQLKIPERSFGSYMAAMNHMHLTSTLPSWGSAQARVVRKQMVGLLDTGFAAATTRFAPEQANTPEGRTYFGSLLELFVINELMKQRTWSEQSFELMHFRTRDGHEIDIVIELADGSLIAVEVKAARNPGAQAWKNLDWFRSRFGDSLRAGVVLHTGPAAAKIEGWLNLLPISSLWSHPNPLGFDPPVFSSATPAEVDPAHMNLLTGEPDFELGGS